MLQIETTLSSIKQLVNTETFVIDKKTWRAPQEYTQQQLQKRGLQTFTHTEWLHSLKSVVYAALYKTVVYFSHGVTPFLDLCCRIVKKKIAKQLNNYFLISRFLNGRYVVVNALVRYIEAAKDSIPITNKNNLDSFGSIFFKEIVKLQLTLLPRNTATLSY